MAGSITRIKTNQIFDQAVTDAKIANATITGGKLANDLIYGSNLSISGNLTVSGTTTTIDTTNTQVADPILVLSRNTTGSASVDAGILIERGVDTNVAFIWDETTDEFVLGFTSAVGTETDVTISSYANLTVNRISVTTTAMGNISISGNTISSTVGDITLDPFSSGNVIIAAGSQLQVADLTATRVVFVGANDQLTDAAEMTFSGNVLTVGGTGGAVVGGNLQISLNTLSSTNSDGNIAINPNGTGNIVLGDANSPTVVSATTASTEAANGALTVAGGVGIGGNVYVGTSGNLVLAATTAATSTTSGSLQTAGGAGIGGNVWVGGEINAAGNVTVPNLTVNANASTSNLSASGTSNLATVNANGVVSISNADTATSTTTGAFKLTGGAGIGGNVWVGGEINAAGNVTVPNLTVNATVATANLSSSVQANLTAVGVSNVLTVSDSTASSTSSSGAVVVTGGVGIGGALNVAGNANVNGTVTTGGLSTTGNIAAGNLAVTANSNLATVNVTGKISSTNTDESSDVDTGSIITDGGVGIAKNINVGGVANVAGTATVGNLSTTGNVAAGNLSVTTQSNLTVLNVSNVASVTDATGSTGTASGALKVTGGVGVGENLWVGGIINAAGNVTAPNLSVNANVSTANLSSSGTSNLSTLNVSGIASLTSTDAAISTTTGALRVAGGASVVGNVWVGNALVRAGNVSRGSWGTGGAGLVLPGATFTDAEAAQDGIVNTAHINAMGTPTIAAANTNVTVTDAATFYIASAPSAGTNVTLTDGWAMWVQGGRIRSQDTTASTSSGTGSLVLLGGAGIGGNLNVGGNIVAPSITANINAASLTGNVTSSGTSNFAVLNANGQVSFSGNIASTTTTSGTLVIGGTEGGLGLAGNINAGGGANIAGNVSAGNISAVNANISGNISATAGTTSLFTANVSGILTVTNTTNATNKDTGALVVEGGVGIEQSLFVGLGANIGGNLSAGNVITTTLVGNVNSAGTSNLTVVNVANVMTLNDGTDSTNKDTGALIVEGGVGIEKHLNVGLAANVTGTVTAGNLTTAGNASVAGTSNLAILNANGQVTFTAATASSDKDSGALVIANGGLGVEGNINAGGNLNVGGSLVVTQNLTVMGTTTTVNSVTTTVVDPIFQLGGGVDGADLGADDNKDRGISFKWYDGAPRTGFFGFDDSTGRFTFVPQATITDEVVSGTPGYLEAGSLELKDTTASTTTTSGALQVDGGAGIEGNLNVGGTNSTFTANTVSSSSTTGAVVVTGGVGVGGNLYVAGNISAGFLDVANITGNINGNVNSTGTSFFANLVANNQVTFNANVASTDKDSGALVIADGGLGVEGNINAGGNISAPTLNGNLFSAGVSNLTTVNTTGIVYIGNSTSATSTTSGSFQTLGGAGIGGDIWAGSAINANGNITGANLKANGTVTTTDLSVTGNANVVTMTANSQVTFTAATASTNKDTGALVITDGGLGVEGNINAGGNVGVTGNVSAGNVSATLFTGNVTSTGTSSFSTATFSTLANVTATEPSSGVTSGALVVAGGAGVGGNLHAGNVTTAGTFTGNVNAVTVAGNVTSTGTSSFSTANFSVLANVTSTTSSTSTDTGALQVAGGTGIQGNLYVGGLANIGGNLTAQNLSGANVNGNVTSTGISSFSTANFSTVANITANTASTGTTSGALQVAGGAGIQGSVFIGGDANVAGNLAAGTLSLTNLSVSGTSNLAVVNANGVATFTGNVVSTSTTTGSIVVGGTAPGGVGVAGNVHIGGNLVLGNSSVLIAGATQLQQSEVVVLSKRNTYSQLSVFNREGSIGPSFAYDGEPLHSVMAGTPGSGLDQTGLTWEKAGATTGVQRLVMHAWGGGSNFANIEIDGNTRTTTITSNVASTSTGTGALVVAGGTGMAGNLWVGGYANIAGDVTAANYTTTGNVATGNLSVTGTSNLTVLNVSNVASITDTTASTTTTTGALKVAGGVGVAGNINVGGDVSKFTGSTASTDSATGAVVVTGGAGFGGNINVAGTVSKFTGATDSTTTATGAVVVSGGVGVAGNINVGGDVSKFTSIVSSTNSTTGAVVVSGGVGVAGNINVAGNVSTFTGTTSSTSNTTGAVTVAGGVGIGGNLYVANVYVSDTTIGTSATNANLIVQPNGTGATIINSAGANSDTIIRGDNDNNLFYVDAGADNVGIGTGTPDAGAKLHISANSSVIIPVGTTGERPANGATGMVRYNISLGDLEFYTGTEWKVASPDFTVIASQVFNGDGTTTAFTLSETNTTASCIVSINGVVQIPVDAYGVSGTTLTFTQAPANGDVIEVRKLTTTKSTVFNGGVVAGATTFTANTASTSKTTGTVVITGGLGVSGAIYAGGAVTQNADLAENYLADAPYEPGTVVEFGGEHEVTAAEDETHRVAGVVSTNPGYLMNSSLTGPNVVPVAFVGRVPTKVRGTVRKGDLMVAAGGGYARATNDPKVGTIIGKALENFDGVEGVIEVVINLG